MYCLLSLVDGWRYHVQQTQPSGQPSQPSQPRLLRPSRNCYHTRLTTMRLINTRSRQFEEFIGSKIPKYAILSHTWEEEEEVSYDDYVAGRHKQQKMKGFEKIDTTYKLAAEDDIQYAWVDTCCIDKRSSAELTEAINSMYRWYERAEVCYTYLSDLESTTTASNFSQHLGQCRW
jgi:hypothetical protein